uniref:putative deoxyribonuclease TATDN2 n=1 Tax=Jaculus jaculus TaxID=51337 RepID=UPI001E1AFAF0|nr:putative deoxyribonuclease TATDN2 [Jaculus jaculus]
MASQKDTDSLSFKDGSPNCESAAQAKEPNNAEEKKFQRLRDNQGSCRIYQRAMAGVLGNSMSNRKSEAVTRSKVSSIELGKPRAPAMPTTSGKGPKARGWPGMEPPEAGAEHPNAGENPGTELPEDRKKHSQAMVNPGVGHRRPGAAPQPERAPPKSGAEAPEPGREPPALRPEAPEPETAAPKAEGEHAKREACPEPRVVRPKIREVCPKIREVRPKANSGWKASQYPSSIVSFTTQEGSCSKMSGFDKEPLADQRTVIHERNYQSLNLQDEDNISSVIEKPEKMIEVTTSSESDWPDVPEEELFSLGPTVAAEFPVHDNDHASSPDSSETSRAALGGTFTSEFPKGYSYYSVSSEETDMHIPRMGEEYRHPHVTLPSRLTEELTITEGFTDTHCHLDMLYAKLSFKGNFSTFRQVYSHTFPNEFEGCITDYCDPRTLEYNNWEEHLKDDMIWGAFGCHPHFACYYTDDQERRILHALRHPKTIAFGEMGLDYSYKCHTPIPKQMRVFERQLQLAVSLQKPVVIHCRNADKDLLAILKRYVPHDYKIHRHCFTSDYQVIQPMLEYFTNMYVGFTALVTYTSSWKIQDSVRKIPLERLLVESDAPYFVPRGVSRAACRYSHPGMAMHAIREIAKVRNEPVTHILTALRENTRRIYNI